MTGLTPFWMVLALLLSPSNGGAGGDATAVRFTTVDIVIDAGDAPLAAYQIEFKATTPGVTIVGIEGGDHPAFSEPPYYDPKAIQQERVILASFNTADANDLPTGKTRVATIHLEVSGGIPPQYTIDLAVAADPQGARIEHADVEIQEAKP
jgi:hypothetical protein